MKKLIVYPHIKIIEGKPKTIVLDMVRASIMVYPKDFLNFIQDVIILDNHAVQEKYGNKKYKEFSQKMIDEDLGRIINSVPYISNSPYIVKNKIEIAEICISEKNLSNLNLIKRKLIDLGVQTFFLIISPSQNTNKVVHNFIKAFGYSCSIVVEYEQFCKISPTLVEKILRSENLYRFYIRTDQEANMHNNPKIKYIDKYWKIQLTPMIYKMSFEVHPYFYGRIFINKDGNFSNSYNDFNISNRFAISDIPIVLDILKKEKFWHIKRSLIKKCKECAFRFCCIDNSIPYKIANNEFDILSCDIYD